MYSTKSGLIIGFHGCDETLGKSVLNGTELKGSDNKYDWLGHGIYFWEGNADRALSFAEETKKRSPDKVKTPFVIGAVLDLGYCLDLLDSHKLNLVKQAYDGFKEASETAHIDLPKNKGKSDKLIRELDCAVLQFFHRQLKTEKKTPYDSVRGLFPEGEPLYEDAGFRIKDHIQICIRNPNCIKGYFLPRKLNGKYSHV